MKLVTLVDSVALERELLARIEHARADGQLVDRTLILLPTRRLASHIERRLLERRPAWLGLETPTFGALVRRVLALDDAAPRTVASPQLLEALLARCLRGERENVWIRHARQRPGTVGRLGEALRDLREAAIDPLQLDQTVDDSAAERDLARIYAAYCRALDELSHRGHCDEAGLALAALPRLGAYVSRYRRIFVYGAYEFLGIYRDLLRELRSFEGLTLLLPIQTGSRPPPMQSSMLAHSSRPTWRLRMSPASNSTSLADGASRSSITSCRASESRPLRDCAAVTHRERRRRSAPPYARPWLPCATASILGRSRSWRGAWSPMPPRSNRVSRRLD